MRRSEAAAQERTEALRAPGLIRLALEWRAPWEYCAAIAATPVLSHSPRGDGHPVLIFPGLVASDMTTLPLRRFLNGLGYAAYAWEQGFNLGPRAGVVEACLARLKQLHQAHGRRVSLIGWSLGGIYARELARQAPKATRLVITMGSPFTGHPKATNAWRIYELVAGHKIGAPDIHEPLRATPPVPTTSIFSRSDGVVSWQCCVEREGPRSENIEIEGSHIGMGFNPLTFFAVADRLAQPEGQWQRFSRAGWRSYLYRDPQRGP